MHVAVRAAALARSTRTCNLQAVASSSTTGGHIDRRSNASCQRRHYARPVNPGSSVDAMLGTSVPPPPREGGEIEIPKFHRPHNPNDLSDLLNPSRSRPSGASKPESGGRYAEIQRIKANAIGAERKSTPIPSRDEMLDEMFKRPFRELEESRNIVDREHPHPIDAMKGRNELDERVLAAARALDAAATSLIASSATAEKPSGSAASASERLRAATIPKLLELFEERAGAQLSIELPYEPTPSEARRVKLTSASSTEEELEQAKDDGVLLLAYVTNLHGGRGKERISVCSGFAVEGGDRMAPDEGDGKGSLIVTCAHTLRVAGLSKPKSDTSTSTSKQAPGENEASIAVAITRTGAIYPIRTLISSLATSDIVLLQLGEEPLTLHGEARPGVPTLPISPYPATVNTELSVSSFWGWEDDSGAVLPAYSYDEQKQKLRATAPAPSPAGRELEQVKLERDDAGRSRWGRARLVEYKDPCGGQALVGTYDELAQLDYKLLLSSPANPPALQGDAALRMSSSVSASTQPAVIATSATKRRQSLPNFPPPGSSGGPVVDVETGSVVGIVRGHKMSPLEGRRGDAIPAEKIFEFFALPGLGKKK
ncbi:hypothetical protein ACQY0O_006878 [Thecaphora frezii]